jgi:hypothetical protein
MQANTSFNMLAPSLLASPSRACPLCYIGMFVVFASSLKVVVRLNQELLNRLYIDTSFCDEHVVPVSMIRAS